MKQESKLEELLPIFVYGTLLPGQPNAHLWEGYVEEHEPAILLNGRLYDMGHFPMLIDELDSQVQGAVLTIDPAQYQELLECLDNLEGFDPEDPQNCPYQRVRKSVQVENGRTRTAWVYLGLAGFSSWPNSNS